jgi:hypothetical protein
MRNSNAAALATVLVLATGCSSTSSNPQRPFAAPIGAPPQYLGAVTSVYTIKDESATLSPPPAGTTPKFGWTRLLREICDVPGGAACSDGHARIEVRLGILDMQSGWSPNIPSNGLVYYVTTTGIRCNDPCEPRVRTARIPRAQAVAHLVSGRRLHQR